MRIDERFVPVPARAVHAVEVDGEAVLLDEAANRLHLLNATGYLVWECLDGTASVGELAADLGDGFGVPYEVALADTVAIVRSLAGEGLFENAAPPRGRGADEHARGERTDTAQDPRFVPEPPDP